MNYVTSILLCFQLKEYEHIQVTLFLVPVVQLGFITCAHMELNVLYSIQRVTMHSQYWIIRNSLANYIVGDQFKTTMFYISYNNQ